MNTNFYNNVTQNQFRNGERRDRSVMRSHRRDPVEEAYKAGYHRGYAEGYHHGNDDYHQSLSDYLFNRQNRVKPGRLSRDKRWYGKKSKSWMWV
jgi:hypothetical protein